MSDDHEDLDAAVADLEGALAALRRELEREADDPDDELPPAERLRIVTEVAIPTLEGLFAANLRTLESTRAAVQDVQADLSSADGDGDSRAESGDRSGPTAADRSGDSKVDRSDRSKTDRSDRSNADRSHVDAADRVDAAVEEVRDALAGSSIPEDAPGRDLLEEARALRSDIGSEVDDASEAADRTDRTDRADRTEIPVGDAGESDAGSDGSDAVEVRDGDDTSAGRSRDTESGVDGAEIDAGSDDQVELGSDGDVDPDSDADGDSDPDVDVDAELETIKRQVEQGGELPAWSSDQSDGDWTFDNQDEADGANDGDGSDGANGDGTDGDGTDADEGSEN